MRARFISDYRSNNGRQVRCTVPVLHAEVLRLTRGAVVVCRMGDTKVTISFDEEYRVRVLDKDKFRKTEEMGQECEQFVTKIKEFNTTVHQLVGVPKPAQCAPNIQLEYTFGAVGINWEFSV